MRVSSALVNRIQRKAFVSDTFTILNCIILRAGMIGMAQSPTKFSTVDWIDQVDELGIVAGGMSDGAITLWNLKKLLAQDDPQKLMGNGCISAA